jgi:hypothetical protein
VVRKEVFDEHMTGRKRKFVELEPYLLGKGHKSSFPAGFTGQTTDVCGGGSPNPGHHKRVRVHGNCMNLMKAWGRWQLILFGFTASVRVKTFYLTGRQEVALQCLFTSEELT